MKNKNLVLYYLARIFYEIYFWGVVAVPFYLYKGYSLEKAFWFIGLYTYLIIFFEFPTGVIGDRYGHKLSVILANFFTALGFAVMLTPKNNFIFIMATILLAIGNTLSSGSDIALLKGISKDFKKNYKTFRYLISATLISSYALAGLIGILKLEYTLYLSIAANLLAMVLLSFIKQELISKNNTSLLETILGSIKGVKSLKNGIPLLLTMALVGGIGGSSKTVISSFEEIFKIDLSIIGFLVAATVLARTIGVYLEKHSKINTQLSFILLSLLTVGAISITQSRILGVTLYFLSLILAELIYFRIKFMISEKIPQHNLASVLSLASLGRRAMLGMILFIAGAFTLDTNFYWFFVTTGLIYLAFFVKFKSIIQGVDKFSEL